MDERGRGVAAQGAFGPKLIIALLILLPTCWTLSGAAPETNWSPLGDALTAENAGLFVGVNDYPKETILPLKFSVNDAVAQAEMFVMRLKLIPAQRCHLLLAGSPTARYAPRLKALQDAGAVVVPSAGRATILFHLETVRRLSSGSNSLLIVSFSGHGNEYRETPYFIPSDGLAGIPSSFLSLTTDVANNLATTGRQKRLLFIDACRLDFAPGQKGNYRLPEVTAAFRQAFAETRGLVTLASCGAGQASLEDPRSESGVFTGKLLTALEEGIGAVDSEFITLGQVSAYLKIAVPKRAAELA
ncbi:MAG: caspase family protein, partial [Verrucomicrobiales bacterium]|nr:caspase family protein [Verrucomicrobiales bacterium]